MSTGIIEAQVVHVTPGGVLLLAGSGLQVGGRGMTNNLSHAASVRVLATWRDAALAQGRLAGSGRTLDGLAGERIVFGG